jgi:hypothetical protein
MCCDEWANTAPDDQGQRLIIQWITSLRPSSGMTVQRPCSKQAKPSASHSSMAGLRDSYATAPSPLPRAAQLPRTR